MGRVSETIPELLGRWVRATPDTVAVVYEAQHITYAELNRRANQWAHYLCSLGVRPEARVAVCLQRRLELIVAVLGIVKAGAAYLALDLSAPPGRLRFTIEDAGARLLLTDAASAHLMPRSDLHVVNLDADWPVVSACRGDDPSVHVAASSLAYTTYTSGSTGRPKGIDITHQNVVRLVEHPRYVCVSQADAFLQFAPLSFDASTFEIWACLAAGARLEVCPAGARSLHDIGALCQRAGISVLWFTAGLFHQMVDSELARLAGVRQLVAGGDVLSPAHVRRALKSIPDLTIVNGYGPTENTTFTTCCSLQAPTLPAGPVPIGRPIANTCVYVLDPHGQPVGQEIPGELHAGGMGVARGYLHQPALTAERFVPDAWSGTPGARLYRTGDRVQWRGDGTLEFLGRWDAQVKIRGYRVELGELEAVLGEHGGVKQRVVVMRQAAGGEGQMVAYVVGAPGVTGGAIRAWLQTRVPEYMAPAAVVMLDALPLTANGKVDRTALPAPATGTAGVRETVAPGTPVEEIVAGVWAEVLGVDAVSPAANVFELGAHSLMATRVVARLRTIFGVDVPLRALFDAPTVRELAARVARTRADDTRTDTPPLVAVRRGAEVPFRGSVDGSRGVAASAPPQVVQSFAQRRLWFFDQLHPGTSVYNVPAAVRLRGHLDRAALEHTFSEIVRRHESLRTTFTTRDGEPVQVIGAPARVAIPLVDLSVIRARDRDAHVRDRAEDEARQPFDLRTGPLLRVTLLRVADDEHVLLLTLHHIVADGWSMGVLVREARRCYAAVFTGQPSTLAELADPVRRLREWQRQWLQGEVLEAQLSLLAGPACGAPPALDLPTDRPRPAVQTFHGRGSALRRCRRAPAINCSA